MLRMLKSRMIQRLSSSELFRSVKTASAMA
jgi:hypothetical protein